MDERTVNDVRGMAGAAVGATDAISDLRADFRRLAEMMEEDEFCTPDMVIGVDDEMAAAMLKEQASIRATLGLPTCDDCG